MVPGHFAQTHAHPELVGRTLVDILWTEHAQDRGRRCRRCAATSWTRQADQPFEQLSGGQQARFQILLLELSGTTALLLDEPTDNLDLESAEALQEGLEAFDGTVLAVTHDRWFARSFDRFLVFGADGRVRETPEPVWDERRVGGSGSGRALARPEVPGPPYGRPGPAVSGGGRGAAYGGFGGARASWLPPAVARDLPVRRVDPPVTAVEPGRDRTPVGARFDPRVAAGILRCSLCVLACSISREGPLRRSTGR